MPSALIGKKTMLYESIKHKKSVIYCFSRVKKTHLCEVRCYTMNTSLVCLFVRSFVSSFGHSFIIPLTCVIPKKPKMTAGTHLQHRLGLTFSIQKSRDDLPSATPGPGRL